MTLARTASQTVGPYYTLGLCRRPENELADPRESDAVELTGQLIDGEGVPIVDGLIEVWDAAGRRWGRSGTDSEGRFSFVVTKPDALPGQAPRLDVFVFARGLLRHQLTRIYFPDEAEANDRDPVLSSLDEGDRATLLAEQDDGALRFNVRMQGDLATVFFEH
jgi:protocatechuate 3,4-dioxygenase, alpha subunit